MRSYYDHASEECVPSTTGRDRSPRRSNSCSIHRSFTVDEQQVDQIHSSRSFVGRSSFRHHQHRYSNNEIVGDNGKTSPDNGTRYANDHSASNDLSIVGSLAGAENERVAGVAIGQHGVPFEVSQDALSDFSPEDQMSCFTSRPSVCHPALLPLSLPLSQCCEDISRTSLLDQKFDALLNRSCHRRLSAPQMLESLGADFAISRGNSPGIQLRDSIHWKYQHHLKIHKTMSLDYLSDTAKSFENAASEWKSQDVTPPRAGSFCVISESAPEHSRSNVTISHLLTNPISQIYTTSRSWDVSRWTSTQLSSHQEMQAHHRISSSTRESSPNFRHTFSSGGAAEISHYNRTNLAYHPPQQEVQVSPQGSISPRCPLIGADSRRVSSMQTRLSDKPLRQWMKDTFYNPQSTESIILAACVSDNLDKGPSVPIEIQMLCGRSTIRDFRKTLLSPQPLSILEDQKRETVPTVCKSRLRHWGTATIAGPRYHQQVSDPGSSATLNPKTSHSGELVTSQLGPKTPKNWNDCSLPYGSTKVWKNSATVETPTRVRNVLWEMLCPTIHNRINF